ncbi:MAG: fibronectin type III domain-containing protein [Thermoanaerobaculia bacterium]
MTPRKLLAALFLTLIACGKRGDPRPPVPVIPQPTSDLVVTQRANRVILTWSYPSLTTAGRSLTEIRRISVYRYSEELPVAPGGRDPKTLMPGDIDPTLPEPMALFSKIPTIPAAQFAKLSQRVDSIEKANMSAVTAGTKLVFTDEPPFASTDGRPVRLTYAVVTEGGTAKSELSNLAILVPLPVAVAPSGVSADVKPEGVTLSWTRPASSIKQGTDPVISGYNIYRTAPGHAPGEFDAPINNAPVKDSPYTDVPPYGEHEYRITAVAEEHIQSDLSQPVHATYKDLLPPPAPTDVTALVETKSVRLLWDPVDAADLAGYRVYRSEGVGHESSIKEIGTVPLVNEIVTATTITDPNADLGIAYRYGITSIDKSGNESTRVWTEWVVVPKAP